MHRANKNAGPSLEDRLLKTRSGLDDGSKGSLRARLRRFYYEDLYEVVKANVPAGARVLELGCGDGSLLAALRPSYGVGIDGSAETLELARRTHPDLDFVCSDITTPAIESTFDYVVVSGSLGYLDDVEDFLISLRRYCHPGTRIVVTYYNFVWEPILKLAETLGLKRKEPYQNWLSRRSLVNLLELADMEPIASGLRTVIPVGPRRLAHWTNRFLEIVPFINKLGITSYAVARPTISRKTEREPEPSVTVVIPTRNERGNIRPAIERLPSLGSKTAFMFVDGSSTDGTPEEIEDM